MIRSELITKLITDYPNLDPANVEQIVDLFFGEIVSTLASGGRVEIRGFGVFETRKRRARVGRNPKTGDSVPVAAKRMPFFKAGKFLRMRIDAK